jgi:hypothetical protein
MPTLVVNNSQSDTEAIHESTLSSDDSHKLVINEGASQDHGQPPLLEVQVEELGSELDDPLIDQFLPPSARSHSLRQSRPSTSGHKRGGKTNRLSRNQNKQTAGE